MTVHEETINWKDDPTWHTAINNAFTTNVNQCEWLKAHRDFIEANAFGFGERSFHWLWKIIIDEMPADFSFLEVGVFRASILSLVKMLSSATGRKIARYGVTPLDSSDGHWESDYRSDIEKLHDTFFIPKDYIIYHGLSTNLDIIRQARETAPYDVVYIDGGHTKDVIESDLFFYGTMVKKGGYLIVDDCANDLHMEWGYFQGIQPVTDAVNAYMNGNENYKFLFNVVHIKVFQKL
jgi:hypothetical protein